MQYALLIVGRNEPYAALSPEQRKQMYADHAAFGEKHGSVLRGGAELAYSPVKTVRPDGDERTVTDGPFAETAEGIGGWYLVEADDIDTATEYAKQIPMLPADHIEVRKVVTDQDR
ncbi:MAG: YciI family protein [Mycobacteriales bacterium]